MIRVLKYVALDILKNKIIIAYAVILALFSWSTFSLEDNADKGILSLLSIILMTVPLMSVLFSTIYIYNSSEFVELLASHPVKRSAIWKAIFAGLAGSLVLAFLFGVGLPLLLFAGTGTALIMIAAGSLLSVIFLSLAFLSNMLTRDKARGIGIALMLWLYFVLLFDGIVLFLFFQFSEYPVEKPAVILSGLNPVDLCRILILLRLDVSAMMGYTGAVFKQSFGTSWGLMISFLLLGLWVIIPFLISLVRFKRKDL